MYQLPELPYPYNALEPFIDEETMRIHHDKHHAAYVKNLNDALSGNETLLALSVEDLLKNSTDVPEALRTKVRNNGGGHANHSLFWRGMRSNPTKTIAIPTSSVRSAIEARFGSVQQFQEKFTACAMGRFGSGWAWLVKDNDTLLIEDTANQDSPVMEGKIPLLGLDVWEHAYYLKYQNRRAEYIASWWNVVNWDEVERRYGA